MKVLPVIDMQPGEIEEQQNNAHKIYNRMNQTMQKTAAEVKIRVDFPDSHS